MTSDVSELCHIHLEVIFLIVSLLVDFYTLSYFGSSLLLHLLSKSSSLLNFVFGAAKLSFKSISVTSWLAYVTIVHILIIVSPAISLSDYSVSSDFLSFRSFSNFQVIFTDWIFLLQWDASPNFCWLMELGWVKSLLQRAVAVLAVVSTYVRCSVHSTMEVIYLTCIDVKIIWLDLVLKVFDHVDIEGVTVLKYSRWLACLTNLSLYYC